MVLLRHLYAGPVKWSELTFQEILISGIWPFFSLTITIVTVYMQFLINTASSLRAGEVLSLGWS